MFLVVSVIAFLISGFGLIALIVAIVAFCTRSTIAAIIAIVIGGICIVLAIVFWIVLIVMLVRKAALENTYCPVLKTACCSGTYIDSKYGYNLFSCNSSSCAADPLSYTVYSTCNGSYSSSVNTGTIAVSCTANSKCEGTAKDQTASVCNTCSISISCNSNSASASDTTSGTYCK